MKRVMQQTTTGWWAGTGRVLGCQDSGRRLAFLFTSLPLTLTGQIIYTSTLSVFEPPAIYWRDARSAQALGGWRACTCTWYVDASSHPTRSIVGAYKGRKFLRLNPCVLRSSQITFEKRPIMHERSSPHFFMFSRNFVFIFNQLLLHFCDQPVFRCILAPWTSRIVRGARLAPVELHHGQKRTEIGGNACGSSPWTR